MKVLHVAAECRPLLKTGGLADVVAALPAAQRTAGTDARVLLPGFPAILDALRDKQRVGQLPSLFDAQSAVLWQGAHPAGFPLYVIEAPGLFDRAGNPYADANHHPYDDNHRRFALLGWVAAKIAAGFMPDWRPDVVHAHDWHAGLAAAYVRQAACSPTVATVFTVHNLAYQGLFPARCHGELGLPADYFHMDGLEFYGQLSFIKAGLVYSDRISAVSPSYAREIQTAEYGCGLDGLLSARRDMLSGILNGVDEAEWDPATDPHLPVHFHAGAQDGKAAAKVALQLEMGLEAQAGALLFGVVSRLTEQKGLSLLLAEAEHVAALGGQIALLGSGDVELEAGFRNLAKQHAGRIAVHIGFDEGLSHRIFAGADVIVIPSRFEPCGLTQMYAQRYGALPLVRRTGGLADTVNDCSLENLADDSASGFVFERFDVHDLHAAVRRAFTLYKDPARWRQVVAHAMSLHHGWDKAAASYLALYQSCNDDR